MLLLQEVSQFQHGVETDPIDIQRLCLDFRKKLQKKSNIDSHVIQQTVRFQKVLDEKRSQFHRRKNVKRFSFYTLVSSYNISCL